MLLSSQRLGLVRFPLVSWLRQELMMQSESPSPLQASAHLRSGKATLKSVSMRLTGQTPKVGMCALPSHRRAFLLDPAKMSCQERCSIFVRALRVQAYADDGF